MVGMRLWCNPCDAVACLGIFVSCGRYCVVDREIFDPRQPAFGKGRGRLSEAVACVKILSGGIEVRASGLDFLLSVLCGSCLPSSFTVEDAEVFTEPAEELACAKISARICAAH